MKHLMRVLVSQTARLSYIVSERMEWNGSMQQSIRAHINMCRCVCVRVCTSATLHFSFIRSQSLSARCSLNRCDVGSHVPACVGSCSLILGSKRSHVHGVGWLLNWSGLPFWISHKYLLLGFFLSNFFTKAINFGMFPFVSSSFALFCSSCVRVFFLWFFLDFPSVFCCCTSCNGTHFLDRF